MLIIRFWAYGAIRLQINLCLGLQIDHRLARLRFSGRERFRSLWLSNDAV
jgi:hypothetical protein